MADIYCDEPSAEDLKAAEVTTQALIAESTSKVISPMGEAYANMCYRLATGGEAGAFDVEADDLPDMNGDEDALMEEFKRKGVDHDDYYELLFLKNGLDSTEEEIKASWRKLIVHFHPDKFKGDNDEVTGETDPRFSAMQIAFDTLTDKDKRQGYDSHYKFDDSIPKKEKIIDEIKHGVFDFYSTFGPVFERNKRFSTVPKVPSLGDDSLGKKEVLAFYQFWGKFDSWRDFSKFDEKNPDQAEGRDAKRAYIQENKNQRAAKKKKEYARLETLVNLARTNDPRLIRFDNEEKEKKEREKNEKKAIKEAEEKAKLDAENEIKAKAEEEANVKKLAAEKAKDDKIKQKKQLRKLSKSLKGICEIATKKKAPRSELLTDANLEKLLENANMEELGAFNDALTAKEPYSEEGLIKLCDAIQVIVDQENSIKAAKEEEARKAEQIEEEKREKERNKYPWSEEETAMLIKAVKKLPGGTKNRWEEIAKMVNTLGLPHARVNQECILQAKWVENNMLKKK